ncbi:MAG: hypothetical protein ACM3SS_19910 [Rhodospirillaceae bacterium]
MLIRDAIARAGSEHHAYFLVAAYIESLQRRSAHSILPLHLTALPINGLADLKRRRDVARSILAMFLRERDAAYSPMRECYEVFNAAVERIFALRVTASPVPA